MHARDGGDGELRIVARGRLHERGGALLPIAQRFLAWRGFPNASGVWVDDFGNPTAIGDNEGDMRPSPILLPWL